MLPGRRGITLLLLLVLGMNSGFGCQSDSPTESMKVDRSLLIDPSQLTDRAPASFAVHVTTSQGRFTVLVTRAWSPSGADRFYNLVKHGYYDDVRFFRVIENFVAQFGINGDPIIQRHWREATIPDDTPAGADRQSNKRGYITFSKTGAPDSRTTQLFINLKDNAAIDSQGFTPFGQVAIGMEVVDRLYKGYGEGMPRGLGPDQGRIQTEGNAYLIDGFPRLDYIQSARLVD